MAVFDALFLLVFWTWVAVSILFLRTTLLPRMPVAVSELSRRLQVEPVSFRATDGVELSGWKIARDPAAPWIILCHGLGTNRADLLEPAGWLAQAGYNLLMFDFRAHGQSQGRATSFGWLEQRDLEGAVAYLGDQPEVPDLPYGVFGVSMGGAVAVMVAVRDERLGAVAVESIYANLEDSLAHHLKLMYRLPRVPFQWFLNATYRLRFWVWPSRMSPREAVRRISPRPVLVIHGTDDPRMPLAEARALFAAAGESKEMFEIPSAGHLEGMAVAPDAYRSRLIRFFDVSLKYLSP